MYSTAAKHVHKLGHVEFDDEGLTMDMTIASNSRHDEGSGRSMMNWMTAVSPDLRSLMIAT